MFNWKMKLPSWLVRIPPAQCEPHQIAKKENGDALPTFRFRRAPTTVDELCLRVVVSMQNGTLALINFGGFPLRQVHFFPRVEHSKYFGMIFDFDGRDIRKQINVQIFGESEESILDTVFFFTYLKVSAKREMESIIIKYSGELCFNASHSEKLALLFDAAATKEFVVFDSNLDAPISAVLATRPYPIKLVLNSSSIDMDAFILHIQGRSATFGSLELVDCTTPVENIKLIVALSHLFEHLKIPLSPRDVVLQLLAAPVKSVCFGARREPEGTDDFLGEADIVPTDIQISRVCSATFMHSFLCRVAQLGHLESLTLCSWYNRGTAPVDVEKALVDAIAANKNLHHLEIEHLEIRTESCWKNVFASLEKHERLRTLCIGHYPTKLDPQFLWLKQLLQRNRRIEMSGFREYSWQMDQELKEICALNSFFRGSPCITRESPLARLSLMGAALTNSASTDFQCTGLLLTDHVDLLCEVLHGKACDSFSDIDVLKSPTVMFKIGRWISRQSNYAR